MLHVLVYALVTLPSSEPSLASTSKQQAAQLALPEIIQTSKQATMSVTLPKKLALAQATSVVQQQVYHHQAYTLFMSNF